MVAVGLLSGTTGESRHFHTSFAPYYKEKRFGIFERKTLEYDFNLSSTQDYLKTIAKKYKNNTDLVETIDQAQREGRHFFYQTETIAGREKYISIVADKEMSEEQFKRVVPQLALDKHLWKWGIASNMVVQLVGANAEEIKVYQDGKFLKFGLWQKIKNKYTERRNPYQVIQNVYKFIPEIERLTNEIKQKDVLNKIWALISDMHFADKSAIDNFGVEKEKHLKVLLQYMIDHQMPLAINGDLFELWQSVFEHIVESYPEVFDLMKKLPKVVMVPGNHDDQIIDHQDIYDRTKELFTDKETGNCNLSIVPHFVHSFKNMDVMMTHGDIADPMNNNTVFGKYVAKLGAIAERIRNKPDTEQVLEGGLRRFFFSDKKTIEGEIINYFNHLMSMVKIYRFINDRFVKEQVKRRVALFYGHTHELVQHVDAHSRVQKMFYDVIDQIKEISCTIEFSYNNTGGGSGEDKNEEILVNKKAYKGKLKKTVEQVRKKSKKKRKTLDKPREDAGLMDTENNTYAYLKGYNKLEMTYVPFKRKDVGKVTNIQDVGSKKN